MKYNSRIINAFETINLNIYNFLNSFRRRRLVQLGIIDKRNLCTHILFLSG